MVSKFLNLLEFELKRAKPFLVILILIVVGGQSLVIIDNYRKYLAFNKLPINFNFFFDQNPYYLMIIGGVIVGMLAYVIYIWVREWQNEGKFIYRLATLPHSRLPIGLAKTLTILFMVFTLILVQNLVFRFVNEMIVVMGMNEVKYVVDMYTSQDVLLSNLLMPPDLLDFFERYAFGYIFLLYFSNSILIFLIEYRINFWKMLLKNLVYLLCSFGIIFIVLWFIYMELGAIRQEWWLNGAFIMVNIIGHIGVMKYLLDKRLNL